MSMTDLEALELTLKGIKMAVEQRLEGRRNTLYVNVADRQSFTALAGLVNDVAFASGQLHAIADAEGEAHELIEYAGGDDQHLENVVAKLRETVITLLLRYPGDVLTGRTNDAQRAFNDGVRDMVGELIRVFKKHGIALQDD